MELAQDQVIWKPFDICDVELTSSDTNVNHYRNVATLVWLNRLKEPMEPLQIKHFLLHIALKMLATFGEQNQNAVIKLKHR
jgi:hypothetical protein